MRPNPSVNTDAPARRFALAAVCPCRNEGSRTTFRFCPECGSTVFYTGEGLEGSIAIPVGAFADPKFPGPTFSVSEERMHSWVSMPPGVQHME